MNFPQYRKYKNIESYFKIISEKEFEEITALGKRFLKHRIKAIQYPEMLRIQDMLNCKDAIWEKVSEDEYSQVLLLAKASL